MNQFRPLESGYQYNPLQLDAAGLRYIGSFINTCQGDRVAQGEHPTWYFQRKFTEIAPEQLGDQVLRNIFLAINYAVNNEANFSFTPRRIAEEMATAGLIEKSEVGLAATITTWEETIAEIGLSGAMNRNEFSRVEGLMAEALKNSRAQSILSDLAAIWNKQDGSAVPDRLDQMLGHLNGIIGEFVPQSRTAGVSAQVGILDEMQKELENREGKNDETFPRHFGALAQALKPKRKQMVTISGPSGGGKSILIHLLAEWWARVLHKRILFILTEDDIETTLLRAAARNLPRTTYKDLDEVDLHGKKAQFQQMIQGWKAAGGEIIYEECEGMTPLQIRQLIEARLTAAIAAGEPFDMVCLDYFQDVDFDTEAEIKKSNRVAVAGKFAVQLRAISKKYNLVMAVASQETVNGDEIKTAWSKRLIEKSQIWLRFTVSRSEEDIAVFLQYFGKGDPKNDIKKFVAKAGESLPMMWLTAEKANRGAVGRREVLYRLGQSQAVYAWEFYKAIRVHPEDEWKPIVFTREGNDFYQKEVEVFKMADATVEQLNPSDFDPLKKKKGGRNLPA